MNIKEIIKTPMAGNFISIVFYQGVNFLLPLISFPYLIRVLEIERWGSVSFGFALMQYFIMFTDFGFNNSGTKYISMHRDDLGKVNTYLNSAMLGRLFLCLVSFAILFILITFFSRFSTEAIFYLLFFGMVIGNTLCPMWLFQGMERMKYMTVFYIIAKSVTFLPLFFLVRKPEDYIIVPVFYSLGYLLAGMICLYIVYHKMGMRWFFPSFTSIRFTMKDSATYFLSRASTSLFTTSNTFLLGLIGGDIAAGYYSAAEKLYQAYNQLLGPFTGVLFPHIAKTHDVPFFKKIFKTISLANIAIVTLVLLLSGYIILIATPEPESLGVFRILMIGCYATIPSILLGYPFLAAMGHSLYTNSTIILTSLFHIVGLLLLFIFGLLSIYSVAIMVVISETILFCFRVWGVRKYNLLKRCNKNKNER